MDVPLGMTIGILISLGVAAFFSLSDAVVATFGAARAEKAVKEGDARFAELAARPEGVRYATLLGKYTGLLTASALVGAVLSATSFLGWGILGFILVALFTIEVGPRSMALYRARALAGPLLIVLKPWLWLLRPLTRVLERLAEWVKPRPDDANGAPETLSEEDLALMIDVGARHGTLSGLKERILNSVFEFGDTIVREVMVPRTDVVAASDDLTYVQLLDLITEAGHSRIPVYRGSMDEVIGVFYAKDLLNYLPNLDPETFNLDDLVRDAFFVPETRHINELFKDMQRQHVHMAIVVNEFGGTAGIVTLEDIFEEFFGEIQDEYDDEVAPIEILDEDHVVADARVSVDEIGEIFDVTFPEHDDYDTLGGYVVTTLGNLPDQGEELDALGLRFIVRDATPQRVERVEIIRPHPMTLTASGPVATVERA